MDPDHITVMLAFLLGFLVGIKAFPMLDTRFRGKKDR